MNWLLPLFVGAVFGALATIATGFFSIWVSHRRERTSIAWALAAELGGLLSRYLQVIGETPDFSGTIGFAEPRFDYFPIFEANASKLGCLSKEDAFELVGLYVLGKGHFENLINWAKWDKSEWSEVQKTKFKNVIMADHTKLVSEVPQLIQRLKKYRWYPTVGECGIDALG